MVGGEGYAAVSARSEGERQDDTDCFTFRGGYRCAVRHRLRDGQGRVDGREINSLSRCQYDDNGNILNIFDRRFISAIFCCY